jgi:transcriptional antiterminator RfaH
MMSASSPDQDHNAWYLIHCQSRKEKYVETILKTIFGFPTYFPVYQTDARSKKQYDPLFPGYVFVQIDLQVFPLSQINACPGVFRIVEFGGEPFPVPVYVLDEIVARSERMNMLDYQPFQPGDSVQFKYDGPLRDLEMIFV